jgi:DNA-binding NtrC family response regulator
MTGFGYDPNHSIVRARREGLAGVLFKPFKIDQLLADLRRALTAPTSQPA